MTCVFLFLFIEKILYYLIQSTDSHFLIKYDQDHYFFLFWGS